MNRLGKKIKALRKARNMSQQELADILNISQTCITKYEKGTLEPDIYKLLMLYSVLGLNIYEVFRETASSIKKSCDNCEFNCGVCSGQSGIAENGENIYGMDINKVKKFFPEGCENWEISFAEFCSMSD